MSFRYDNQLADYGDNGSGSTRRGGVSNGHSLEVPTAGFMSPRNNYMSQDQLYQSIQGQGQLHNQRHYLTHSGYLDPI